MTNLCCIIFWKLQEVQWMMNGFCRRFQVLDPEDDDDGYTCVTGLEPTGFLMWFQI